MNHVALSADPEQGGFTAELTNPTSGETYALECTLRFSVDGIDVLFPDYWRNIVSRLGMDLDTYDVATEHWLEIEVRRQWLAAQRRGK